MAQLTPVPDEFLQDHYLSVLILKNSLSLLWWFSRSLNSMKASWKGWISGLSSSRESTIQTTFAKSARYQLTGMGKGSRYLTCAALDSHPCLSNLSKGWEKLDEKLDISPHTHTILQNPEKNMHSLHGLIPLQWGGFFPLYSCGTEGALVTRSYVVLLILKKLAVKNIRIF